MAEYTYNAQQVVEYLQPIILNNSIPCPFGYVYHRNETGNLLLRSANNCCCHNSVTRYQVTYNGNIALNTGATVGPIAISLSVNGEPITTSKAIVTPAAVGQFFNVTSTAIVDIPRGCCFNVAVENVSDSTATILVENSNVVVTKLN